MGVDLTSYGLDTTPSVRKQRALHLGARTPGYLGRDVAHNVRCYVTERDSEEHRYHGADPWYDLPFDGAGYGLSVELFSHLYGADAGRVYIAETDTGTVYHFGFQQFVDGAPINFEDEASDRGFEKDPQTVVALDNAVDSWDDAAATLYARQPPFE